MGLTQSDGDKYCTLAYVVVVQCSQPMMTVNCSWRAVLAYSTNKSTGCFRNTVLPNYVLCVITQIIKSVRSSVKLPSKNNLIAEPIRLSFSQNVLSKEEGYWIAECPVSRWHWLSELAVSWKAKAHLIRSNGWISMLLTQSVNILRFWVVGLR